MEKKKTSPILLVAAICLVTLAVLGLIGGLAYPQSAMMAFTSFGRQGVNSRQFTPPTGQDGTLNNNGQGNSGGGNFPAAPGMGSGGDFSGAPGMGSGGTFSGTPEAGRQGQFNPNGQNGTYPNRQFGTSGRSVFSWILPVGLGLFLVLAVISAIFLLLKKKWAGILALVLAFLTLIVNAFAIYSQLGLARFMSTGNLSSLVFTILEMVLAVAVIVLLLLPKGRAIWAVKSQKSVPSVEDDDDFDDDDDNSDEVIHPVPASVPTVEAAKTQAQIANRMPNPLSTSKLQQSKRGSAQKEEDDVDDDED